MTMLQQTNARPMCINHPWLRALLLTLALAGCGGDVDTGGTGASTSFASGPITGFGSVIVNGVRFDDTLASVTDDDGGLRSRNDLRLGMTADVRGSAITTDASGTVVSTASAIAFGSDILGVLDSIDVAGKQLVVLGQPVDTNVATVFDDSSVVGGLPALTVGDVVEVYALFNTATGRYTATRIERKSAVAAYRLRGLVSNLNTATREFNIGTQRVSYLAYAGSVAALANGNFVRVRLQTAQVGGAWPVVGVNDGVQQPRELDEVRLEGLINAFTSASQFSVNGVAVDASGITPVVGLALGVRVEAEGTSRSGVLVATKVKVKSSSDVDNQEFELRGAITSVDAANLTFVLRGTTVSYSLSATDFRDGTAANLLPGVNVEARGMLSANGTRLAAARINFK